MFDINTPPVVEPDETIDFDRRPGRLMNHVRKHILNREERWFQFEDFDPETIRKARENDKDALRALARAYIKTLRRVILNCGHLGIGHQHFLAIKEPPAIPLLARFPDLADRDQQPELVIECLSKKEKLFVVARASVKSGELNPYSIRTGFRPYIDKSGNTWMKRCLGRKREKRSMTKKRYTMIADHQTAKAD